MLSKRFIWLGLIITLALLVISAVFIYQELVDTRSVTSTSPPTSPEPPTFPEPTTPVESLIPTDTPTEPLAISSPSPSTTSEPNTIKVGSKNFTEQKLLRQMLILKLAEAGYTVEDKGELGDTTDVRAALESGEIDLYWEYTGTALSVVYKLSPKDLPKDPNKAFNQIKALDKGQYGLEWLNRGNFNNTYTLVVRQDTVEQGITTLEELAQFMQNNSASLKLCVEKEFYDERPEDGLSALLAHYGFAFKEENIEVVPLANRLQNYEKLRNGECDVAEGFSTDGEISAWGLHSLQDTLTFFPPYNAAPVIRQEVLEQYPELADILGEIGTRLDETTMRQLNACVDLGLDGVRESGDEKPVEEVARLFIESGGIACLPPRIIVSSLDFTESIVLGEMVSLMLQEAGYDVEEKMNLGDTPTVRAAQENGEIDLYWEYTGTVLAVIHGISPKDLPREPNKAFNQVKSLDKKHYDLVWLNRANFNNTYTLMVRQSTVEKEKITTIEELAAFMNENDAPLKLCVEKEFYDRKEDGLFALLAHYGFAFKEENIEVVELAQRKQNHEKLLSGECDVAEGFGTDGEIAAWGFQNLEDTKNFFPAYNPAPVIRQEVLDKQPELEELLGQIGPYIDQDTMIGLNKQVDIGDDGKLETGDEESAETVARLFLCEVGLLKRNCPIKNKTFAPQCEEIVLNGGFERDGDWELPSTAWAAEYSAESFHSGARVLRLGIINPSDDRASQSVARQLLTIPSDAITATLSYWYYPISNNLSDDDEQGALIYNPELSFIRLKLAGQHSNEQAWSRQDHELSAFIGEEVYLYFYVDNDGNGEPSAMYLDDVSLQVCWE